MRLWRGSSRCSWDEQLQRAVVSVPRDAGSLHPGTVVIPAPPSPAERENERIREASGSTLAHGERRSWWHVGRMQATQTGKHREAWAEERDRSPFVPTTRPGPGQEPTVVASRQPERPDAPLFGSWQRPPSRCRIFFDLAGVSLSVPVLKSAREGDVTNCHDEAGKTTWHDVVTYGE